jgi:hypothetical protein
MGFTTKKSCTSFHDLILLVDIYGECFHQPVDVADPPCGFFDVVFAVVDLGKHFQFIFIGFLLEIARGFLRDYIFIDGGVLGGGVALVLIVHGWVCLVYLEKLLIPLGDLVELLCFLRGTGLRLRLEAIFRNRPSIPSTFVLRIVIARSICEV